MAEFKKRTIMVPILITVAALLDLVVIFCVAARNPEHGRIRCLAFLGVGLIAVAIFQWVIYARRYIDFAIEQKLSNINKEIKNNQ